MTGPARDALRRVLVAFGLWLALAGAAHAESKLAFVVGIDSYANLRPEFQLERPSSDADAVAQTLTALGFQVSALTRSVTQDTLLRRLSDFTAKIQPGDTALFYFAGHGIALENTNYLLPSDIPALEAGQEFLARARSLSETDVRQLMRERGARVVVMVIDACRDNPFPKSGGTRGLGVTRGLVPAEPAEGVFTLYSAALGQQALDRLPGADENRNSVFTRVFVAELKKPAENLIDLGENVRDNVSALADTAHLKQTPAYYNEVRGARRIFLGTPGPDAPAAGSQPASASPKPQPGGSPDRELDLAYWTSIKDSKNPKLFEGYLQRYPSGAFSEIARIRLDASAIAAAQPLATEPAGRSILQGGALGELRERLYELNFDPGTSGDAPLRTAIREFEQQSKLPPTGEPTDALLRRLREMGGLKPWGAIVYDSAEKRWGAGFGHPTRQLALKDARSKCGQARCTGEVTFFGAGCGAFAQSSASWSLIARDTVGRAAQDALQTCGRRGPACRIIATLCADGTGRALN